MQLASETRFPDATLSDIRQSLRAHATDLLDPEGTGSFLAGHNAPGYGRMNIVVPASQGNRPPPPEPDVGLTAGTTDTGQYGNNYGSNVNPTVVVAAFEGDVASSYELHVTGYDVDYADEISVTVNGNAIGYLARGRNNRLNDGDVFLLDPAILQAGTNTIEFEVSTPGYKWGVTGLGVFQM